MSSFFLGIVPARGGSKRIPGKNLSRLAGKSLLAYTADAVRQSTRLTTALVSTDSREIAQAAAALGLQNRGLRPANLAQDQSPTIEAAVDTLTKFETGGTIADAVVILQPTSPFRTAAQIDEAIALYESSGADTVVSVRESVDHPYWAWRKSDKGFSPFFSMREIGMDRSELPEAFMENGAIYIVRRELAIAGRIYGDRVVPYPMDDVSSLDIDTPEDVLWAEFLLARRRAN